MPTILELAGVECPDTVDGESLLPFVRGERPSRWRADLHGEHVHLGQSLQWVTDGRWKYLWASARGIEQLFDLENDPDELHDLADEPPWSDELARWRAKLVEYLTDREEGFVADGKLVAGRPVQTEARRVSALVDA